MTQTRACTGRKYEVLKPVAGYSYRVVVGQVSGEMVEVDLDDDGSFDGWTAVSNLTPNFGKNRSGSVPRQNAKQQNVSKRSHSRHSLMRTASPQGWAAPRVPHGKRPKATHIRYKNLA